MALGRKTGGRVAGTPNKRTVEVIERLESLGCDPIAGMAKIVPGLAIYSFAVLIVVVAGATSILEPRMIWRRAEEVS